MTSIKLSPEADADQVMRAVRETFESRDYHWEPDGAHAAVASEGGRPVGGASLPVARRVRVSVRLDPRRHRLALTLETLGAAYSAAGAGWFYVQLASRYRAMVRAVREDLAASALR